MSHAGAKATEHANHAQRNLTASMNSLKTIFFYKQKMHCIYRDRDPFSDQIHIFMLLCVHISRQH